MPCKKYFKYIFLSLYVLVVVAYCLLSSTVDYLTGRQDLLVNVWVSASFGVSLPYLLLLACRF
ncbi:hypothetical protein BD770DRAFT_428990, partial [Pilaira anomala]